MPPPVQRRALPCWLVQWGTQSMQKQALRYLRYRWPDPLPRTAMEAMAAGRPVVGYQTGGVPEMVVDGETGFLVEPGDVD